MLFRSIMRNLLAENLEKGATKRTVAAISERNPADANADVAEAEAASRPTETVQVNGAIASADSADVMRPAAPAKPSLMAAAAAALPPPPAKVTAPAKPEPAQFTSGVISTQPITAIPGSAEPMKPVKVKTVQVKAGSMKLASAGPSQPAPPVTNAVPSRPEVAETSSAVVARASEKTETARVADMPPQPANFGTGQGVLGVLPAASAPKANPSQALAYADPSPRMVQDNGAIKTSAPAVTRSGWIIQVGALESEGEAKQRIDLARSKAASLLSKADPFTEPVVAKDNRKLFRARFAGLERDHAEAVCKTLKRADISCITVRN